MKITTREHILEYIKSMAQNITPGASRDTIRYGQVCLARNDSVMHAIAMMDVCSVTRMSFLPAISDDRQMNETFVEDLLREYRNKLDESYTLDSDLECFASALKRIPDTALWVVRENLRFLFSEYKRPLFMEQLYKLRVYTKQDLWWHFPHVSVNDPAMIAYTQTREKGQRDIQTPMKVGRYLQQFYGDVLTEAQIRAMANGVKNQSLHWATTASEMEDIYVNSGIHSCMAESFRSMDDLHPVHVYDFEGQFKLSYLRDGLTNNIIARGLVHEPTKSWVRVFGNEGDALREALAELGYFRADGYHDAYIAYLTTYDGKIVMPYIDGDCHEVTESRLNGRRCWRIVSSGDHVARNTHGYLKLGGVCGSCGEETDQDEEDMIYSDHHDMHIGRCCESSYRYAQTRNGGDYVHEDDCVYCESDGEYYESCYADHRLVLATNDNYYFSEDVFETPDGDYVYCEEAIEIDGEYYDMENINHAKKMVVYVGNPESNRYASSPTVMHSQYLDDDEPKIVDNYGNEYYVNWRSLRDMIALTKASKVCPNNDEGMAELRNAVFRFNTMSGFDMSPNKALYAFAHGNI